MSYRLSIPKTNGASTDLNINNGSVLFVVGANGAGKSSLMHHFDAQNHQFSRRISAHRQTWLNSNGADISPQGRHDAHESIRRSDLQHHSRFRDDYGSYRTSVPLFDLIRNENRRARSITSAFDSGEANIAQEYSLVPSSIAEINSLLCLSNLSVQISLEDDERLVAKRNGFAPYSIAELSDGERNALLIGAEVLTVPPGTLLIIDEPERHLHRSIISPLFTALFNKRSDCAFIVSTHDISLPLDSPDAQVLLVRGCQYNNQAASKWDFDLVKASDEIDDAYKKDILGSKRKLLFVEGEENNSMDKPLYSILFPGVSVISKSSCRDVEQSVLGLRNAINHTWLSVFGVIDNDSRTPENLANLQSGGVHSMSVRTVESLYYHPDIIKRLAHRQSQVTGEDENAMYDAAKVAALTAINSHLEKLSAYAIEKTIRSEIDKNWPTLNSILAREPINIVIDPGQRLDAEIVNLKELICSGDLASVVARYPIRKTAMLGEVAKKLGFTSRYKYEAAVLKLLRDSPEAVTVLRNFFGSLYSDISRD